MKKTVLAALSLVALAGISPRAEACNPLLSTNYGKHVRPTIIPAAMLARNQPIGFTPPKIVGLWHDVRTASDGTLFTEGYDTWNHDGTENELTNLPPASGNLCVGVWKQHGNTIQLLTHVAWLYDLSNSFIGTLNIVESDVVSRDGNSYTGSFDAKFYDPSGNLFHEVTGTTTAERLAQ